MEELLYSHNNLLVADLAGIEPATCMIGTDLAVSAKKKKLGKCVFIFIANELLKLIN